MNLFKDLVSLPEQAIWCLKNSKTKKVWISSSTNLVESLGRTIASLKDESHRCKELIADLDSLRFEVLEVVSDRSMLKLRTQFWIDQYRINRWTSYRNYPALVYTVKTEIEDKVVYVVLETRGRSKIKVAAYDSVYDADSFIADVYPKGRAIEAIKYGSNELTLRLIKQ